MAELCGSLPRRHRRRRSRQSRSRSRHASRSRSANIAAAAAANAHEERPLSQSPRDPTLDMAKEVAKLRAEYDSVMRSQHGSRGARGGGGGGCALRTDLNSNVVAAPAPAPAPDKGDLEPSMTSEGQGHFSTRKTAQSGGFEPVLLSDQGEKVRAGTELTREERGRKGCEGPRVRTLAPVPFNGCQIDPRQIGGAPPDGECGRKLSNKTENVENSFETDKTDSVLPKSTILVKQCESLKTSVIEKHEPLVNGMSFKSALESRKEVPKISGFQVEERKPPVSYSRKNSLLSDDGRKNSAPKIDTDWRQNSSRDTSYSRNDTSKDRRYSHSKEYSARRNSLPREGFSARSNSFSRDEAFSRKNSLSKNEFAPRRNSFSKEDYPRRRNSAGKGEPFAKTSSAPREEQHSKIMPETNGRRSSFSDNAQSLKNNSLPRIEGPTKSDEIPGKNRSGYCSKVFKSESGCAGSRKNSFSNSGPYSRRNSWSKTDITGSPRNEETMEWSQIRHENRSKDDGSSFRQTSKSVLKSDGAQRARKSSWSKNGQFSKKCIEPGKRSVDEEQVSLNGVALARQEFCEKGVALKEGLISLSQGSACGDDSSRSGRTPVPACCNSVERGVRNATGKLPWDKEGFPVSDKSTATTENPSDLPNENGTESPGIEGFKLSCTSVNTVERGANLDVVNTSPSPTPTPTHEPPECHHNHTIVSESEKVGSLLEHRNRSSNIVNTALNAGHSACWETTPDSMKCLLNKSGSDFMNPIAPKALDPNKTVNFSRKPDLEDSAQALNLGVGGVEDSDSQKYILDPVKLGSDSKLLTESRLESDLAQDKSSPNMPVLETAPRDALSRVFTSEVAAGFSPRSRRYESVNAVESSGRRHEMNTKANSTEDAAFSPALVQVCERICNQFSRVSNSLDSVKSSVSDCSTGELGQWSPTNPVGKKKYSKDFLVTLADLPQCRIPPSLPPSLRMHVEKVTGGGSGGGPSMFRAKVDELFPFSKGSSQSPRSSHGPSAFNFPLSKRPSQRGNQKPMKINVSLSLHEDVKLKETENAWKPAKLAKKSGGADVSSEEKKTEELYNKVRSILNKLTPQKLDTLVNQIKELPINNPERLAGVVDLIIKKAIDEPNFSEAYAKMCKILSTGQYMSIVSDKENIDKNQTDFRRVLLNCCQKQFELREKIELDYKEKIARELKELTDQQKIKELKLQHQEEERKIRMKAAGHCRFIGELFKLDMLKTSIMHNCILYLLKKTDEEPLESLCKLLTTIGKHYESRLENPNQNLDPIMSELSKLASKSNKKKKNAPVISSRIRFMIQDVLDLRANNWVPRRDDNTPKTIDQIHKEAEREQLDMNIALANTSMKKMDRPRMDDRKKGGRMDGLMSSDADSWQTPKNSFKTSTSYKSTNYSIDTSKFENFKLGMGQPLESMRLGMPRPNMWASGAVTNKGNQPDESRTKIPEQNQFALLENSERDSNQYSFNSSTNKSSSISRDKSRDSRNLSQDDDMLPKRGAVGPAQREGSIMRSAPPSIQPPAALKPVLDPETLPKIVRSTLDEYISVKQISEVEHTLKTKFVTPACAEKFVDAFIEYFLEKRKDQEIVAPVLGLILDSKISNFTPQVLVDRFNEFLSMAEDLIIDYPKLWDYMAMIMGYTLSSEHFNFDHVRQSCKSILKSENSRKVLALVFNVVSSIKTPIWISHKWNTSKVTLKDFIADNDIDEFVKANKLEYLTDPDAPILKSSTPIFTFDEIKTKLLQILKDHPDDALVPVQNWVNENWGPGPYDHTLIRPLMTAICEAAIMGSGDKIQFNKEALEKHSKLLKYYVDYNPNLEAHCLMAICMLMEKLQHPKGLALNFFQYLMEHTMSAEGFSRFHRDPSDMVPPENIEEHRIKGVVVLGTRSFWVSVEELENSDDEETS